MTSGDARRDRALGALLGLAIGDALGMPTQSLPRSLIVSRYGPLVERFEPAPADHPIAAGMARASVTDDTDQAVIVARLLVAGNGDVAAGRLAAELLSWQEEMRQRGSLDLLGPSTNEALDNLLAGTPPGEAGRRGTTNGAAMRIAPVGIATASDDPRRLADRVESVCRVTHNTGIALAGAAAVAMAVSTGLDGATVREACERGADAAASMSVRGHWVAGADVAMRIRWAVDLLAGTEPSDAAEVISDLVGTSLATQESVPAAFAVLAVHPDDTWSACRLAASLGGDCDTIAAMAGAIGGACHGAEALPAEERATVISVNHLDFVPLVDGLLAVRGAKPHGVTPDGTAGAP